MATASNSQTGSTGEGMSQGQGQGQGGVGSPISNQAYNIVSALASKLEGLEAYRKYAKDGDAEVWQRLTQAEMATVSTLVDELERLVQSGQFRMRSPGQANS